MHSSYQLNTVFTDVYLLLLQNYKLAQVATGLTSRYSYGTTLLWKPVLREARGGGERGSRRRSGSVIPNRGQTPQTFDRLHGRKEADGQQVCLQLGSIEETEANHTVYYTPDSPVQQFCCICVSFFRIFLKMKAKLSIFPPKTDCQIWSWRIIMCNWKATYSYIGSKYRPHCR